MEHDYLNMEAEIVKLEESRLDEVCAIEQACFLAPWPRSMFINELENDMAVYYAAIIDGHVVGYAGMWHIVNEGHINNIAVGEDYRRQGVGQALLDALLAEASARGMIGLTLEVASMNKAAQRLYMKNGFKMEGLRKGYYREEKDDAIIMWKYL